MRLQCLCFRMSAIFPAFGLGLALAAGACSAPRSEGPAPDLTGELVTYMVDYDDHSETTYALRDDSGQERPVAFDPAPAVAAGTRLSVWGNQQGPNFKVARFEVGDAVQAVPAPLIDGTKKAVKRWAFVIANVGGTAGALTQAQAQDRLFNLANPRSMRSYYREVSYGVQDLDGQVFAFNYNVKNACDTNGVVQALRPMVTGAFDQYLWYFGSRQQGCGWAGLASLGTADRPQPNSWYNASAGCVVLAQEPGHNFGMVHSSSMRCTANGAGVSMIVPGGGTCQHSEYGNIFDPMGSGCFHMDGFQKAYQNWLTGCNVVKVTKSGTFTVFPLEKACNGVQLLQVPMPAPRAIPLNGGTASISNYYLELRAPLGLDAQLTPRVLVTVGAPIAESRGRGGRNWLLDMNPQTTTFSDAALPVGKTFSDPAPNGPKFTVMSADAEKAVIQVQLGDATALDEPGAGTCDDSSPFQAPGPVNCSAPPANVPPANAGDGGAPRDATAADTTPPPEPDAAEPDVATTPAAPDAAVTPGGEGIGGAAGTGGPTPTPPPVPGPKATATTTGGCGCSLGAVPRSGGALLSSLGLVALLLGRRRRR
jgi:MYXO-CTERM domain-containing protein